MVYRRRRTRCASWRRTTPRTESHRDRSAAVPGSALRHPRSREHDGQLPLLRIPPGTGTSRAWLPVAVGGGDPRPDVMVGPGAGGRGSGPAAGRPRTGRRSGAARSPRRGLVGFYVPRLARVVYDGHYARRDAVLAPDGHGVPLRPRPGRAEHHRRARPARDPRAEGCRGHRDSAGGPHRAGAARLHRHLPRRETADVMDRAIRAAAAKATVTLEDLLDLVDNEDL